MAAIDKGRNLSMETLCSNFDTVKSWPTCLSVPPTRAGRRSSAGRSRAVKVSRIQRRRTVALAWMYVAEAARATLSWYFDPFGSSSHTPRS